MGCRGGLTLEEGAMMTTTESTKVPFREFDKGDGNCTSGGDGDSDSDGDSIGDGNNNGSCDGSGVGNDNGYSDKA